LASACAVSGAKAVAAAALVAIGNRGTLDIDEPV
jgi:hypothetical protein